MLKNHFKLYDWPAPSTKGLDRETAKVIKAMINFTSNFDLSRRRKRPRKPWRLYLDFDAKDKEFYLGTDDWLVIISTDEELDAEMQLKTTEHSYVSCGNELDFICAIRDRRHDFVNEINKTLNKTTKRSTLPLR